MPGATSEGESEGRAEAAVDVRDPFEVLFEDDPDALLVQDAEDRVLAVNCAAERLFALAGTSLVGRHAATLLDRAATDGLEDCTTFQTTMRLPNGKRVPVERRSRPIRFAGSRATLVRLRDLSKVQLNEREFAELRERDRVASASLLAAREKERRRIARELHDELGQQLTGLKLDLAWIDNHLVRNPSDIELLRKRISFMSASVGGTIESVRRVASALSPTILEQLGLRDAIEWQVTSFQARSGVRCNLELPETIDLDAERSIHLFRIVQELLTNVARHSGATRVDVRMTVEESELQLEVRDNGRGVKDSELYTTNSLGVLGMLERSFGMHGNFLIYGRPGRGTTAKLVVPLDWKGPTINPGIP